MFISLYANDNSALIPQVWVMEGLAVLTENMVATNLVHRDFSNDIASRGDVVNAHRPSDFTITRATDASGKTDQDAVSALVPVSLDQFFEVTFIIKDGEASKSQKELIDLYVVPAMRTIARGADRAVLGRAHEFLVNRVGKLNDISGANSKTRLLEAREKLNKNKAPDESRNLILSPGAETALLENDIFVTADKRGDDGTALRRASLGGLLGFDIWMSQNTSDISDTDTEVATGTVTDAQSAGDGGSQTVVLTGHETAVGEFVNVVGDQQPYFVTAATTGGGDTTAITLSEVNKNATLAVAVLTVYKSLDVDGAFPVGHSRNITVDGYAANKGPQIGQLIAFGTGASRRTYTVIEVTDINTTSADILLERNLEVALADGDLGFPGPSGSFNLAFNRDALAFVSRPLALPPPQHGVEAAVGVWNNIPMRIAMQYDLKAGGTRATFDMLAGTALLDINQGVVLLG